MLTNISFILINRVKYQLCQSQKWQYHLCWDELCARRTKSTKKPQNRTTFLIIVKNHKKKKITRFFSYLTAVRSVHCFTIFVIHCVTSLIRLCLLLVCIVVSRIFLIGARFFHGHSALDHGFIFGVLNCLQFILTQISCLI